MSMKFTHGYRNLLTARVEDLAVQAEDLRMSWTKPPAEEATWAAQCREAVEEIRKTLDAVEEVVKEDLYQAVVKQVRRSK